MNRPGYDALWLWFGLSYASFIVVPRVLAHEMPDEWQARMAELLHKYEETFPNFPTGWGTRVQLTIDGKLASWPSWVLDYRHPDVAAISSVRARTEEAGAPASFLDLPIPTVEIHPPVPPDLAQLIRVVARAAAAREQ